MLSELPKQQHMVPEKASAWGAQDCLGWLRCTDTMPVVCRTINYFRPCWLVVPEIRHGSYLALLYPFIAFVSFWYLLTFFDIFWEGLWTPSSWGTWRHPCSRTFATNCGRWTHSWLPSHSDTKSVWLAESGRISKDSDWFQAKQVGRPRAFWTEDRAARMSKGLHRLAVLPWFILLCFTGKHRDRPTAIYQTLGKSWQVDLKQSSGTERQCETDGFICTMSAICIDLWIQYDTPSYSFGQVSTT